MKKQIVILSLSLFVLVSFGFAAKKAEVVEVKVPVKVSVDVQVTGDIKVTEDAKVTKDVKVIKEVKSPKLVEEKVKKVIEKPVTVVVPEVDATK
ncbi:MAG: hypothetical protein PHF25_00495 [Candidatus Margulisbacteria bacterium]|nr:hypothetical protein [Candidatus Margulisiibacteriota bacterium]